MSIIKRKKSDNLKNIEEIVRKNISVSFSVKRIPAEKDFERTSSIYEKGYVSKPTTKSIGYLSDLDLDLQQHLQKTIAEGIKENLTYRELAKKIQAECNIGSDRAELISITELARAYTNAYVSNAKEFGIETLIWNVSKDDLVCKICLALDGKKIPVDEAFDCIPNRSHPRCRCYLTSAIE